MLLTRTFGLSLSREEVEKLWRATEGWVAGLCLTGHALRHESYDRRQALGLGSLPDLRRFLDTEVLPGLPADHLRFLEQTYWLERLDPDLCNLITGRIDSKALLEHLVEINMFTEEVSASPPVYRYHALLSDWLEARVNRSGEADISSVLGVASRWYEKHGLTDLAIGAALREDDPSRAEQLIRMACGPALRRGLAGTVAKWVSSLPVETLDSSPDLALVLARAAGSSGDIVMATAGLTTIGRIIDGDSAAASPSLRLAHLQLDFLVRLFKGDLRGALEMSTQARAFLANNPDQSAYAMHALSPDILLAHSAAANLLVGEFDQSIADVDAVLSPSQMAHPSMATVLAVGIRALVGAWKNEIAATRPFLEASRRVVDDFQGSTADPLPLYLAGVWCADIEQAEEDLAAVAAITTQLHWPLYAALHRLAAARYEMRVGRLNRARSALTEAGELIGAMPSPEFLARLAANLDDELVRTTSERAGAELNDREVAVLREIADGASRREVSERLHLSMNTVKTYLRTAYRKLGAIDRDDAVKRARRMGLLNDY